MADVRCYSDDRLHPRELRHRLFGVVVCSRVMASWISSTPAGESTRDGVGPDVDPRPNCVHFLPNRYCM
jgi:hypothetical protein